MLETCLVALILFLLWHPALSVATLRPQQNVVAVLVDDSRSMSHQRRFAAPAKPRPKPCSIRGLLKGLSDSFQVRLYKFGKEPERIQKPDQLTASAARIAHRRYAGARAGGILVAAAGRDRAAERRRR